MAERMAIEEVDAERDTGAGREPDETRRAGARRRLPVALVPLSHRNYRPLWSGTLLVVGFGQQVYNTQNNALVQEEVDSEYRGRVVSILFLNRGLVPLGTAIAGFGTDLWGAPAALGTMALLMVLLAVFVTGRRLVATQAPSAAG